MFAAWMLGSFLWGCFFMVVLARLLIWYNDRKETKTADDDPDDIYISFPDSVHIERMSDELIWLRIQHVDGAEVYHFDSNKPIRWTMWKGMNNGS